MTRSASTMIGTLLFAFILPMSAQDVSEKEAVAAVVNTAYVEGIHKNQDGEAIRAGFHESFVMFIQSEGTIKTITRDDWIGRIERGRQSRGQQSEVEITAKIEVLDMAHKAAVVRVYLYRDGHQVFTDYMSLYKFDDGWKIIAKIFQKHPFS